MKISIYKDVFDKTSKIYRDVDFILEIIKNGKYKDKIHQLRQNSDKDIRSRIKQSLVSICFSGVFETRFDKELKTHSGLVILDFDHIKDLEDLKNKFKQDKYCFSAFISPSGDGLKVLFKIPAEIDNHEKYYLGIVDYCKKQGYPNLDTTSKNPSRVCFVSYDPEIFINLNSEIFSTKASLKITEHTVERYSDAQATDFGKLNICCEIIRNAQEGDKHHSLIKASRLAGGYVAGGYVEEFEAVRLLESEINRKNPTNFKAACKTIQDGIEFGKKEPIAKKDYKIAYDKIIKEDIIVEDEPAKDVILCGDLEDKLWYGFKHGTSMGETTHIPTLDEHYRMKRGEVTLWHGIPNMGKSTFVYQLALIKAKLDGTKWGVFSPENLPYEEFYKDLIHAYIGKSTEPFHGNQMSENEFRSGINFIKQHFFLIYPETAAPTLEYMNNRFRELIIKQNIDGAIIDPYNQMDNDITSKGGREDQYLSWFLTNAKRFATEQNIFYFIVTHPKSGLSAIHGNYEMPNVYNLSGGAMWNNKVDNINCVHRPNMNSDRTDTSVIISTQKIKKQKICGIPGETVLDYDRHTARYYYEKDRSPLGNLVESRDDDIPSKPIIPVVENNNDIKANRSFYETDYNEDDGCPF